MWLMLGCGDPNTNTHSDLPADYSIKASNPQPQKLSATSNMTQNHQVVRVMSEQGRRTSSGGFYNDRRPAAAAPTRSSRWNPTQEQLMTLEELYRHGLKTPTAQQIRLVTLRLRIFGKIEGKNVFYWFQNHRARERQKRRRELIAMSQSQSQAQAKEPQQPWTNNLISNIPLNKESAGGQKRSTLEVEQQKKWTLPNCTVHSDQESSSVLQERMDIVKSNSSRSLGEQSDAAALTSEAQLTNSSARVLYSKLLDYHHCYDYNCGVVLSVLTLPRTNEEEEERSRKSQTLELFPLESENLKGLEDTELSMIRTASTDTTAHFMEDPCFQFL